MKLCMHPKRKVLKRKNVLRRSSKLFSETYFSPDISFTHNRKVHGRDPQKGNTDYWCAS